MFEQARAHLDGVFDFLDTLDCYIGNQSWMELEIKDFAENDQRQIAALVSQNISEKLTYRAPFIRIIYVLSGALELQIDNKTLHYSAGCLIMANEWTKVEYRQYSPDEQKAEAEVVSFLFKKEYFTENVLNQLVEDSLMYRFFVENVKSSTKKSNFFVFEFEPNQDIHFYAMLLLKQVVKMRYKDNKITKSAFNLLVSEIGSLSEEYLKLKDSTLSSSILIHQIISDIEEGYQDTSLKDLADKYYFHPNYLSSFIKEETGKTFSELMIECRLKSACMYLKQTKLSVQEIIEEIGYTDKSYFYTIFKKEFGITPREYRRRYKS
ncbi:MAG TPA: helix-turn-helix transcriptional regulator [Candidatus Pelethocola excrementipullorum]|nr:helix-turn-helix transcriptional regulator [Candidatus Pelethocola excrementipullorum]